MKKHRAIIIITAVLLVGVMFLIKFNTWLYVTVDQTRSDEAYDITVSIDNKIVFSQDSVYVPLMGHERIRVPLRAGFHKIKAYSRKGEITTEKTIFLIWGQMIVVEYFKEVIDYDPKSLWIRTIFPPYIYM